MRENCKKTKQLTEKSSRTRDGMARCSATVAKAAKATARELERERDSEHQGKRKQPAAKKAKVVRKNVTKAAKVGKAATTCGTGRDLTMGTFHTLGKLLYNKRLPEPQAGAAPTAVATHGSSRCERVYVCVNMPSLIKVSLSSPRVGQELKPIGRRCCEVKLA
jgi:hypothetical protein